MAGIRAHQNIPIMNSWITTPSVKELLDSLYADSAKNDPLVHQAAESAAPKGGGAAHHHVRMAYMAVPPEFGRLLYSLARNSKARTIVEFGTSFGVSTIFLAAALRDNGEGGKVITTEFSPEKADRARKNIAAAGLSDWVEFRVGDALQTLADSPRGIDLVFLDGSKTLYLDILKLIEPQLRSGAIIASDNTDHDGLDTFLDYIRNPAHGYTSSAILTGDERGTRGHEITVRN